MPNFEPSEIPFPPWRGWNPDLAKPLEVSITLLAGQRVNCGFIGNGPSAQVWCTGRGTPPAGALLAIAPKLLQRLADTARREVYHHGRTYLPLSATHKKIVEVET